MDIKKLDGKPVLSYKFFYGETVKHKGNGKLYTICDLSNASNNYYGMWLLGTNCAVPTHGSSGDHLESIAVEQTKIEIEAQQEADIQAIKENGFSNNDLIY